jgi:hypothetical protein
LVASNRDFWYCKYNDLILVKISRAKKNIIVMEREKMSEDKVYTEAEAERFFAIEHNGIVWNLLGKQERTPEEDALMVHAAHSSCMHWLQAGTPTHHQRGEWLIAHVYSVLGYAVEAMRYAKMCMELTKEHPDMMQDFDRAYAYEAVARAAALAGKTEKAKKYHALAAEAGEAIANKEDKKIFIGDFEGGDWYGLDV